MALARRQSRAVRTLTAMTDQLRRLVRRIELNHLDDTVPTDLLWQVGTEFSELAQGQMTDVIRWLESTLYYQRLAGVIQGGWALLRSSGEAKLYDRRRDPAQLHDVSNDYPDIAEALVRLLEERAVPSQGAPATIDERALKSLGYIE